MREWLKEQREQANLSQADLARKLELKPDYYFLIETNQRQKRMDITLAVKLAAIFNLELRQIVEWEEM